jgi:hypothetical protein
MPDQNDNDNFTPNPGYIIGQLSKAFQTKETHEDEGTRERAAKKVDKWIQVFQGVLTGALDVGSRTPVKGAPAWATLEVATGGFATGKLLAGGKLQDWEREKLRALAFKKGTSERAALNGYYVSDAGVAELQEMLRSGKYRIEVPEEGALLAVAWLLKNGNVEAARRILEQIGAQMSELRFYPQPATRPVPLAATGVVLQDVRATSENLTSVSKPKRVMKQRETLLVWAPLQDRMVELFVETVEEDWPCQRYPDDWTKRAEAVLREIKDARQKHKLCGRPTDKRHGFALLHKTMETCVKDRKKLTGRQVGLVRVALKAIEARRGLPQSEQCRALRAAQTAVAQRATRYELARVLLGRLHSIPATYTFESLEEILYPVTQQEASAFKLAEGTRFDEYFERKLLRCTRTPVEVLLEKRVITSAEKLAGAVAQLSAQACGAGIEDESLRRLYSATYQAFRKRRSLLLWNLASQVKFNELPWVAALEKYSVATERSEEAARELLQHAVKLTFLYFPHQITPNKLVQEFQALSKSAGLDIPLVEELAADIFMGTFSAKFLSAAKLATGVIENTLYERYYDVPVERIRFSEDALDGRYGVRTSKDFDGLCAERAEQRGNKWVANNGVIIEQAQILTTHNLAVLWSALDMKSVILPQDLDAIARRTFRWVCKRQRINFGDNWHSRLIMMKNTAYAWRQMIFFVSMMPADTDLEQLWIGWAYEHFRNQHGGDFVRRFEPAINGLSSAAAGKRPGRVFLGWSAGRHWLMTVEVNR